MAHTITQPDVLQTLDLYMVKKRATTKQLSCNYCPYLQHTLQKRGVESTQVDNPTPGAESFSASLKHFSIALKSQMLEGVKRALRTNKKH